MQDPKSSTKINSKWDIAPNVKCKTMKHYKITLSMTMTCYIKKENQIP